MVNQKLIKSQDGSFTMFSTQFKEHYHSVKDGAFSESLYKHVNPALTFLDKKQKINILDINFGLGFNTFTTIYKLFYENNNKHKNKILTIYSPEIDKNLVKSLNQFPYPKIFKPFQNIINSIAENGFFESENLKVYIYFGDTRDFLTNFKKEKFDIVYQDAFSPNKNPTLWTKEYFKLIKNIVNNDVILTTYSIATPVRLALHENSFYIYDNKNQYTRTGTIATLKELDNLISIDMEYKRKISNKKIALSDFSN